MIYKLNIFISAKTCKNLLASVPAETKITCSNGNTVGSKCTYSCMGEYELVGGPDIFCRGTKKWTNEKVLPKCKGK